MAAGVLYFVIKYEKFLKMAKLSAKSLKNHMPHLRTALFTDLDLDRVDYFDDIIHTETPKKMWIYKWECLMKSPYNPTLHLDADTYICDSFPEVFDMMDRFDLVTLMSPYYISDQRKGKDVPICFPEVCGGFLLWKQSRKNDWLFQRVAELVKTKTWGTADEPSIRQALYESKVRYAFIPWEYTCVFNFPGYIFGKVKIMHGKSSDIVADAEIFNQDLGRRVYTGDTLILTRKTKLKFVELDKEIRYGSRRTRGQLR